MVSEQDGHKPSWTSTEDGLRLEILDLESRDIVLDPCSENKGAGQLRVTAKLTCAFVFEYANCWFSHVYNMTFCYVLTLNVLLPY